MLYEIKRRNNPSVYVQVDEEVVDAISEINWCYADVTKTKSYVMATYVKSLGDCYQDRRKTIYLHKFIYELLNGPITDGRYLDHINGDTLDCRMKNLRLVSVSVNSANKSTSSSKYVGVRYIASYQTYQKKTRINIWKAVVPKYLSPTGEQVYLGHYPTEVEAATAIKNFINSDELIVRSVHEHEENMWNGVNTIEHIELEIEKIKKYKQSIDQLRTYDELAIEIDLINQYKQLISNGKNKIKQLITSLKRDEQHTVTR